MALKELKIWLKIYSSAIDILKIYERTKTYENFVNNKRNVAIVLNKLKSIGKLSESMPDEEKAFYKNIDWEKITMLKKVESGDAFGPDLSIIWEIMAKHIYNFSKKLSPPINRKYKAEFKSDKSYEKYKKKFDSLDKYLLSFPKKIKKNR